MIFLDEILNIIFPRVCSICDRGLTKNEELICFHCRSQLPKTRFGNIKKNELVDRFCGKLEIEFGSSYLYFYKSGITQKLLHQFKYKNNPEIGLMIGKWFGHELSGNGICPENVDLIIPVPLHWRKQRKRGYNQSIYFARGISQTSKIPVETDILNRIYYEESQTRKTKIQRWKSVEHAFEIADGSKSKLTSRRVMLVDDVTTTGATLEACGKEILNCGATSLGIATMAIAK